MTAAREVTLGGVLSEAGELLTSLGQASVLTELAVLVGCLAFAWLAARLLRRAGTPPDSLWFGRHIFDGLLFPVLALAATLLARWLLKGVVPIAVFKLAVPVLTSLLVIRIGVRALRAAFPASQIVHALERSLSWVVWGGLVLWATGFLPYLWGELEAITWKAGGHVVTLSGVIEGALTAAAVMVGAMWLASSIEARLLKGVYGADLSVRKIASNAIRALLLLVGFLLAMSAAGIPLGALGVMGGALGVGIGFGLQKLAANYVSGFVILAERSLRIGDMVKVDNFEGRISDINTRYTVIRALGGREAIVPNEMLITQRVENSSLADPQVLLTTTVQVAYGTDIEALAPQLVAAVAKVARVLKTPEPGVQLSSFAADGLELTIPFWISDPENGQGTVRSEVNLAILRALNSLDIQIPFPQHVVHTARA